MAYGTNAPFGLRPLFSIIGGSWAEKTNVYYISPAYPISIFEGDMVTLSASTATVNTIALYVPVYTQTAANAANTFTQITPVLGVFVSCEYYDATNKLVISKYWPAATQVYAGTQIKAYILDDPNIVWDVQVSTPINAAANGAFAITGIGGAGRTAAPIFPGTSNGQVAATSGIGSNYSIMGGGGVNFNTIASPYGGFYANNPVSTLADTVIGTPTGDAGNIGINPFGGNTATGQSGAYLCVTTLGANTTNTFDAPGAFNGQKDYDNVAATLPLKVIGYTPEPRNVAAPGLTLQTTPFINLMVTINNHVFKAGTAGQTFGA